MDKVWVWVLLFAVAARRELVDLARWTTSKPCLDAYKSQLTIYSASALHKDFIPKLGMGHVTLAGISHHGLRNFEVWLQSMAPGVATPVHSHPPGCEEINFVLEGTGLVRTRGRDGSVTEHAVGANDTMIAPPGTVWQVENTHRRKDLRVLVVIGCGRPGISFFSTWNDTSPTLLPVMPWNQQCPPPLPAAALRQVQ